MERVEKEQAANFRRYIGSQYQQQLASKQRREVEARAQEKAAEQQELSRVHGQLEAEKSERLQKLRQWRVEAATVLNEKEQLKRNADVARSQEKAVYTRLMLDRAQKEKDEEARYRDFFRKYQDNLKVRQNLHESSVGSLERRRQLELSDWEQQRAAEYVRTLKERDDTEHQARAKAKHDTVETLRRQVEEKERQRDEQRRAYSLRAQEGVRLSQEVSKERQQSRERKVMVQQKYREFLEQQLRLAPTHRRVGGESLDSSPSGEVSLADLRLVVRHDPGD